MCLLITKEERPTDKMIVWKKMCVFGDHLISTVQGMRYEVGWNVATGEPKRVENVRERATEIHGGALHFYILKPAFSFGRERIVPFTVWPEDYIAHGRHGDICFKKCYLSSADYSSAVGGR